MHGNYGIVSGLLGLDAVHDFATELHPAYLLAVRYSVPGASPERWGFFVRNWGNEGMCSHFDWRVPVRTWSFKLPWRTGAKAVRIEADVRTRNAGGAYDAVALPDKGIIVTAGLGDPASRNVIHGDFALYWDHPGPSMVVEAEGSPTRNPMIPWPIMARSAEAQAIERGSEELSEMRLNRALARLSVEGRRKFAAAIPPIAEPPPPDAQRAVFRAIPSNQPTQGVWDGPARWTYLTPVVDSASIARTLAIRQALCNVYHNQVPDLPALCQGRQ